MKAPNAGENPTLAARTTIPKHIANERINMVSLLTHFLDRFRKIGIK